MSEIPFVKLLGDELERAARRAGARGRRPHRIAIFAAAGALLVSGTALATGLFSEDAERQATSGIVCVEGADPRKADISVLSHDGTESPVATCRRILAEAGAAPHQLVACSAGGHVTVIWGEDAATACKAAGVQPLAADYEPSRARTAKLEREILAIEDASGDCIAPADLAGEIQRLLERSGWVGWQAEVRNDIASGPCGVASSRGGDGRRRVSDLDAADNTMTITGGPSRRVGELLFSEVTPMLAASGEQCFTFADLSKQMERPFIRKGVTVSFKRTTLPAGAELDDTDGRATRYQAGCAVIGGGASGPTADSALIEILAR